MFVNKPLPPEIELTEATNDLVILNYFDYTRPEFVKEKHQEVFQSAVGAFADGLISYLEGEELVNVIMGDTLVKSVRNRLPSEPLEPDSVVAICNRYNVGLLLTIDSLYIGFDWETEVVEDDDGSSYKVKYFYLEVQPFISLYNSLGNMIDRSFVYRQVLYSDRLTLSSVITIKPALIKALGEATMLAAEAGGDYGSKFFESTGTFGYKVYTGSPFEESFRLMQRGSWAVAIRELLPLASSDKKTTAKRAANNLSVAYIGLGDETSANMWKDRSLGVR